ncbi:MAG: hypothetical protein O2917_02690 [Acidobacteria bacterium]|nr:hypothetical protein [Acidobacteriota bacterium]
MTVRTAAAIASLALTLGASSCLKFYDIGIETPVQAKLDVSSFQRVLVLGFLSGGSKDVDANSETVRLLRSQLRNRSDLRVVDSDVLNLVEEVDRRRAAAGTDTPATPPAAAAGTSAEPQIMTERDLQPYEEIFADVDYWKRIGEEYQAPLIITGSVLFTDVQRSGPVARSVETLDQYGRRTTESVRRFEERRGYALVPKFIFIDGRTGVQLHSESFREETLYSPMNNTPPLSSYFELMDRLLPGFLSTLSTQKIRGTRTLLK